MMGPTDLLHPSPAPHFKTFQVFLIYCTKCPIGERFSPKKEFLANPDEGICTKVSKIYEL
jgi:hypothetical protein